MVEMTISDEARALIKGSYDLHIHSAPDVMPRKANDLEFARRAAAAGMGGIMLKSHYVCTADRATLVNEVVQGTKAFGALTLNHAVGALNPIAVDIAGRSGARLVWFPTVDAEHEVAYQVSNPGGKKAYWYTIQQELKEKGMSRPPFSILGEDGKLIPAVKPVLEVIAAHDMILSTGHVGPAEVMALVKAAKEIGVKRILVCHPEFPSINMPLDMQIEAARMGALMERCFTTPFSGKISWEAILHNIRAVGPAASVISTDLGQPAGPWPDEGMAEFAQRLLDADFTPKEVRLMMVENPGRLVNL